MTYALSTLLAVAICIGLPCAIGLVLHWTGIGALIWKDL